ncbi:MAG: isocitrate/isopropylmalate family dehydrogenase [Rickettsiales bacterium]|nr:isocitrate/isopropylmalate family dehydrogenase [Rickettsiales bacterium]
MSDLATPTKTNKILVAAGQGIGPECITATQTVLAATGVPIEYDYGNLGFLDPADLMTMLHDKAPDLYKQKYGEQDPAALGAELQKQAKATDIVQKDRNKFYLEFLKLLDTETRDKVKELIGDMERETLNKAGHCDAVLKGPLRTLDEGDEPSKNVTIRKAYEQYANIRRCVTLDPIVPGAKGTDILFVRENVEDLYASIEHRLGRNYAQALRHMTPEACELISRAAFEAALRDGRKSVTALEKPNILKITGGDIFKNTFLRVAQDYSDEKLGAGKGIKSNFMIIDDGLAAIAATPERFDVIVTSNMFGDIGSDVAAKITGGIGLVSSNNTNPSNPKAVSMFEAMGGTAEDIAGQNKANPVALLDSSAEMLLHIGGKQNIEAAEMIKAGILQVLADGYFVGDIREGEYQKQKGKGRLGTKEFAEKIAEKITAIRELKAANSSKTVKQIAVEQAEADLKPLFERVLRDYESYAKTQEAGTEQWLAALERNVPPSPVRAVSKIVGFDMFVDDSGLKVAYNADGSVNEADTKITPDVEEHFKRATNIDVTSLLNVGSLGSLQAVRSYGQFLSQKTSELLAAKPELADKTLGEVLTELKVSDSISGRFAASLKNEKFAAAVEQLDNFAKQSIKLTQAFYSVRKDQVNGVLVKHGFKLAHITSRGTEVFPTMGDLEKREVDGYRILVDDENPALRGASNQVIQQAMTKVVDEMAEKGWVISETLLNRNFIDGEGAKQGQEIKGVSKSYATGMGSRY